MTLEKLLSTIGVVILSFVVGFSGIGRSNVSPPDDFWFQARVVERPELVLVKFGAEWCPPCRAVSPELHKLSHRVSGLSVVEIDIDEKPELADHYNVSSIPRMFLMRNGKIEASRVGGSDADVLERWVRKYL